MTVTRVEDIIAEHERQEFSRVDPNKFATFAGRLTFLVGIIFGIAMPDQAAWPVSILAGVGIVWVLFRAVLNPDSLMRPRWVTIPVTPSSDPPTPTR